MISIKHNILKQLKSIKQNSI